MQDYNAFEKLGGKLRQEIRNCAESYYEKKLRFYRRVTVILAAAVVVLGALAVM